jgi:hypothetical protein
MTARWSVLCAATLLLAACGPGRDVGLDAQVRSVFDQLRHGDQAALVARLDPAQRTPAALGALGELSRSIPPGAPRARRIVSTTTLRTALAEAVSALDEYDYGDHRLLVGTRLGRARAGAPWSVQGVRLQIATAAQLARNDLTLQGKPWRQDLFLGYVALALLLMAAAFWKVVSTPGLRWKWLWAATAFLGVGAMRMNWTTGQFIWQPVSLNLIGAGLQRGASAFSPWMLSATIPVGALLILAGLVARRPRAGEGDPGGAP